MKCIRYDNSSIRMIMGKRKGENSGGGEKMSSEESLKLEDT
jgi:hypothetical protein